MIRKEREVIYAVETGVVVTVTVYVFYGAWEVEGANTI